MLKAIPTILLLFTIHAAKAAEPTLADAWADFDDGKHSAALAKISRILRGSAAKPGTPQRYDLFMLRGECLLQHRSSPQAAEAFTAALGEVEFAVDPKKAAQARAMMILTKGSPRQVYRPTKDAPPIDILAPNSRKQALGVMLEQRFTEAEPKIQAAIASSSLLPTKRMLPTLADLYALELVSTGDVARTLAAIQVVDGHARQLLEAELRRIKSDVDDLHDLANEVILSEGPRQQLTYRGLTSPQRDELRSLADTLLEIEKVVRDGESINKSVGNDRQAWQALMKQCSKIKATAQQAFERSY